MGLGRFLIKGGLVPECKKKKKEERKKYEVIAHAESNEQICAGITPDKQRNIANLCLIPCLQLLEPVMTQAGRFSGEKYETCPQVLLVSH